MAEITQVILMAVVVIIMVVLVYPFSDGTDNHFSNENDISKGSCKLFPNRPYP